MCVLCTQWHAPDCIDKHTHSVRKRCFTCLAVTAQIPFSFVRRIFCHLEESCQTCCFLPSSERTTTTYFTFQRWTTLSSVRPVKKFCHLNLIFFSLAAIIFSFIHISAAPTSSSSTERATQMWNIFWKTLNSDTVPPVVYGIAVKSMNVGEAVHIV